RETFSSRFGISLHPLYGFWGMFTRVLHLTSKKKLSAAAASDPYSDSNGEQIRSPPVEWQQAVGCRLAIRSREQQRQNCSNPNGSSQDVVRSRAYVVRRDAEVGRGYVLCVRECSHQSYAYRPKATVNMAPDIGTGTAKAESRKSHRIMRTMETITM